MNPTLSASGACAVLLIATLPLASCASRPPDSSQPRQHPIAVPAPDRPNPPKATPPGPSGLREVFPHIRVDAAAGTIEFDAAVCIDAHNPKTPRVYLEVLACTPDTKEHESLVVTNAAPSQIHAALLLLGLQPGTPGTWDWEGAVIKPLPPSGPRLMVTATRTQGGSPLEGPITDWVLNVRDNRSLTASAGADHFVFAGSQMIRHKGVEMYRADGEGCIVGLCTFGGETIAWSRLFSPDTSLEEPQWIADGSRTPPFGTPVIVRIRKAD
ncbi:hypothetical protein PHYC_03169 [Phycisphaerales bacterium]|nr:hypothetical protein PHYC_03169 [Phycisphaerales bacterium]